MQVTLYTKRGQLQSSHGKSAGSAVQVTRERFLIGCGEDCHLRCESDLVSRHHCVLHIGQNHVVLHDLNSAHGTFVNDKKIQQDVSLADGDKIRFGRFEFQVAITQGKVAESTEEKSTVSPEDELGEDIGEWLTEADEIERAVHKTSPETRQFKLDEIAEIQEAEPASDVEQKKKKKKKPGKLPQAKRNPSENTISAAERTLAEIMKTQPREK